MKKALLAAIAVSALTIATAAYAAETATTTTTQTVKSTAIPGATVTLPGASVETGGTVTTDDGADVAIPADEDGAAADMNAAGTVTTTTTTKDVVTTTKGEEPAPVDPAVPAQQPAGKKANEEHAGTGKDEATTAGDKAAKSKVPLQDSSVPKDPAVKVEQKDGMPILHN